METNFDYCDKERAWFSSDEPRWINRIRKLAARFPDQVTILRQPEDNDGCIVARLPQRSLQNVVISPRKYSDEELTALRKRFELVRKHGHPSEEKNKPKKETRNDDQNA